MAPTKSIGKSGRLAGRRKTRREHAGPSPGHGMIDRITILGGSSVYIPEFVLSLIAHNVRVREIVLLGHPGRKLDLVAAFCQRIVDKSGYPVRIAGSSDPVEAVGNAKYILNHVRVGGMPARVRDEMLPPKYGMLGHESLGAGGLSNALRTLPVVLKLAEQIVEVNPEATFINLTNPVGIVSEALLRHTPLNVIGVSELPATYTRKVAALLQEEHEDLEVSYVGLNHLGWIQDVKVAGRSKMTALLDLLDEQQTEEFDNRLIQLFRMIPTRHSGIYFNRGEILKRQKSCARFRAEILHEAELRILKLYEDPHLTEVPDLTRQRNAIWYEETIVPLIQSLEADEPKRAILCLRNEGSIRDLSETCAVELAGRISASGVERQKPSSLPRFLKGLFLAMKESDRLVIEAVRHKSYDFALQALTINPFVASLESAEKYLERVIREDKLELH